eukprot:1150776-Pelagomonas_calceolata.AAC.4
MSMHTLPGFRAAAGIGCNCSMGMHALLVVSPASHKVQARWLGASTCSAVPHTGAEPLKHTRLAHSNTFMHMLGSATATHGR